MSVLHEHHTVAMHLHALAERYLRISTELMGLARHFSPPAGESDVDDFAFSSIVERSTIVAAITGLPIGDIVRSEVERQHDDEEKRRKVPAWIIADQIEPVREFAWIVSARTVADKFGSPWPELAKIAGAEGHTDD